MIYRVPELPRCRPPRLPRLFAVHRLCGYEPGPPCVQPLRLLQEPDHMTTPAPRPTASSTTSTTPCWTWMRTITLETIQTVFQDYKLVNGTWDVRSPAGKLERVRPRDIKTTAPVHGGRRAGRYLRRWPDRSSPRPVQRHRAQGAAPPEAKGAGHYGIFSGRRWRDIVYPKVRAFHPGTRTARRASGLTAVPAAPELVSPSPSQGGGTGNQNHHGQSAQGSRQARASPRCGRRQVPRRWPSLVQPAATPREPPRSPLPT